MTESAPTTAPGGGGKKGMSTGAKLLFGCLALAVVGIIGLAAVVMVGGVALWRGADSVVERVEEQQAATETLRRIEEEYPFEPPADGVVGEARAETFMAVVEDAWDEVGTWAEDLEALSESASSSDGGGAVRQLGELAAGARAIGGMVQSRVALVEVLDQHDMSLAEFVWTGLMLSRAAEARDGERSAEGVPEENVDLATRYGDRAPALGGGDSNEAGAVLGVATMWGLTELSTWRAMGLDTLMGR